MTVSEVLPFVGVRGQSGSLPFTKTPEIIYAQSFAGLRRPMRWRKGTWSNRESLEKQSGHQGFRKMVDYRQNVQVAKDNGYGFNGTKEP